MVETIAIVMISIMIGIVVFLPRYIVLRDRERFLRKTIKRIENRLKEGSK